MLFTVASFFKDFMWAFTQLSALAFWIWTIKEILKDRKKKETSESQDNKVDET